MGFSDRQVRALRRNVDGCHIRVRQIDGRELSYLEGWYAISAPNRIFGFDGWNRETLEAKCVLARENRGAFVAVYTAKVRITVHADGSSVVREGHGTGEGRGNSPGEAHDTALKAAETDATKRAPTTFGRPFGLELYRPDRKSRAGSPRVVPRPQAQTSRRARTARPLRYSTRRPMWLQQTHRHWLRLSRLCLRPANRIRTTAHLFHVHPPTSDATAITRYAEPQASWSSKRPRLPSKQRGELSPLPCSQTGSIERPCAS